jgi:hypothetical protein
VTIGVIAWKQHSVANHDLDQPDSGQNSKNEDSPAVSLDGVQHAVAWLTPSGDYEISYAKGKGTNTVMMEYLAFDPKDKSTGPAGGSMVMTMEDTPVKRILSMGSMMSGSMWAQYGNTEIDLTDVQQPATSAYTNGFGLFEEKKVSGEDCCRIAISIANHKSLTIASNYQVFYDGRGKIGRGGPFATLRFKGDSTSIQTATLQIWRNDKNVAKGNLGEFLAGKTVPFKAVRSSNDVVSWKIEDANGHLVEQGDLGFPVSGALPDTVQYCVDLAAMPNAREH